MRILRQAMPLIALEAVALDTETTSLDSRQARIVQIGGVKLAGNRFAEAEPFIRLVSPGISVPKASTEIHGLSDADLAQAPSFAEAFADFRRFAGDAALIGHNIDFDIEVLQAECARAGLEWRPPPCLDVRVLARIAAPNLASHSLDALSDWLGIKNHRRHDALSDASAAAQIYMRLLLKLKEKNIRTLAEALTASHRHAEFAARAEPPSLLARLAPPPTAPADDDVLVRLDSYPYRHRVRDIMRSPAVFAPAEASIEETAKLMTTSGVSAVLVSHAGKTGIVTERDLLRAVVARGAGQPDPRIGEIMSAPLHCVGEDDFIYRALGRMDRLSIRHLPAVNAVGEITGMLTPRILLRQRTTAAIALGDEIAMAEDVAALGAARAKLSAVARCLLAEEIDARDIAAVISSEICALTAQAACISEARLLREGRGAPPMPYALLVLGSGGRGESLLAADQDNAIVYERDDPSGLEDAWFEALGRHIADILDEVGVPYCKGGVMARNAAWRQSMAGWRKTIDSWINRSRPQDLLNVDIFFDATPVRGQIELGHAIRAYAYDQAKEAPAFIKLLSENAAIWRPPFTLLGNFNADEGGRVDLKRGGLSPLFTGARALAIKHGVNARSTSARLQALIEHNIGAASEIEAAIEAHKLLLRHILDQQLIDATLGRPLGNGVDLTRLNKAEKARLKDAIRAVEPIVAMVNEAFL